MRRKDAAAWDDVRLDRWCANLLVEIGNIDQQDRAVVYASAFSSAISLMKDPASGAESLLLGIQDVTGMVLRVNLPVRVVSVQVAAVENGADPVFEVMTGINGPWWDVLASIDPAKALREAHNALKVERAAEKAQQEALRLARIEAAREKYADSETEERR